MLFLCINNYLTTDTKSKLRYFKYAYTFNTQDDGYAMLSVIVKMLRPDTRAGCLDTKYNLENTKMSHLKHDTPKDKLHIAESLNEISISGETYSEIVMQQFTLYSTLSCPLFKDYMETRRSEWEENKGFTAEQVRSMTLKKYNNLLTSERWYTKYPKNSQIIYLVGIA